MDRADLGAAVTRIRSRNIPLTARQQRCLCFIATDTRIMGRPPSLREIGEHMGISSTNGVRQLLGALEAKGRIERMPGEFRRIRITPGPEPEYQI